MERTKLSKEDTLKLRYVIREFIDWAREYTSRAKILPIVESMQKKLCDTYLKIGYNEVFLKESKNTSRFNVYKAEAEKLVRRKNAYKRGISNLLNRML